MILLTVIFKEVFKMKKEKSKLISDLDEIISKFLEPIRGIPFHDAIKSLTGTTVIKLDLSRTEDRKLVKKLKKVANIAMKDASREGIFRSRPNEVGNDIETYVKDALRKVGFSPDTPKRKDGKRQATGYPDIYFKDDFNRHIYLECKTYNKKNIDTTQRSFYLSPSVTGSSKIIYDAIHIIISFEIIQVARENKRCYEPVAWKLVDIYSMKVNIKHEFNASNKAIYKSDAILADSIKVD